MHMCERLSGVGTLSHHPSPSLGPRCGSLPLAAGPAHMGLRRPLLLFLNKFIYLFIYFWLRWAFVAAHGIFSSCAERGLLFVAVRGLLIVLASLVAEHRL